MSYRIEYKAGQADLIRSRERKKRNWWAFALIILLMSALASPVRERVFRILIPGDDDVTIQAFREMVDSLRGGDAVSDAFEVFCREVIYEGA